MRSSALPGGARNESVSPQRWPLLAVLDDTDAGALLDQVQPRAFRRGQAAVRVVTPARIDGLAFPAHP